MSKIITPFTNNYNNNIALSSIDNCLIIEPLNINKNNLSDEELDDLYKLFNNIKKLNFNKSLLDLRAMDYFYDDIKILLESMPGETVLIAKKKFHNKIRSMIPNIQVLQNLSLSNSKVIIPTMLNKYTESYFKNELDLSDIDIQLKKHLICNDLKLNSFFDDYQQLINENKFYGCYEYELYSDLLLLSEQVQRDILTYYLNQINLYSPLIQLTIKELNGNIKCLPMHTGAFYTIQEDSKIFITRPSILAKRCQLILQDQINEFEYLLNKPNVKEFEFQDFFERNKSFLLGSDYKELFPQVVLERNNNKSLIPDFFLQPIHNNAYLDILDIKLPNQKLVVGTENRRHLSSYVTSGIAQLRTYSEYFDNPRNRAKFRDKFKLDCYKPSLTLVIGRNTASLNEDAIRNEMSHYSSNLRIKTYEDLLLHAKSRLLL